MDTALVLDIKLNELKSYLNDHQAGSVAGLELAKRLAEENPGDDFYRQLSKDIEKDRDALERLMKQFGASGSTVKQAGAWMMEKVGSAMGADDNSLGTLRKIEALTMGIRGKECLWNSLIEISPADNRLEGFNFERLAADAFAQIQGLEERRVKAARKALTG
ncbi:MAG: hypothetical protein ACT4OM_08115 [Actinomycetota bacterium]